MARAKKPVSVNGIEFDALITEDRVYEASTPEYAVESGFVVSDTIIHNPFRVSMVLYVTETPVTWKGRGSHGGKGWTESVCDALEELYFSGQTVTVVTTDRTYKNMAIETMTISKNAEIGYAREIPITFKEVRVTKARTTSVPSSYGKSGVTQNGAGDADTGSGSGGSGGGSGDSGSSGGGGSTGGGGSGGGGSSDGSILHGWATGSGLIP